MSTRFSWGNRPMRRAPGFSLLPARLSLGASMLYHGVSKLTGRGPEETGQFFEQVGVRPGRPWAIATGIAETLAGFLAVTGIATRPAALAVLVTQGMAVQKVHKSKGFSNTQGGFEFNLALMAIAAGLILSGPGRFSLHRRLERKWGRRTLLRQVQRTPAVVGWLQ